MLQQYFALKQEHPGIIIAIRVGDFYEFYGEDAETAASTLEITLTGRDDGGERIPMAGVPHHAFEKYAARLVQAGLKVAICDQLEDPKKAKGLVKRGITRILTPGTALEDSLLDSGENNFLAAISCHEDKIGLAFLDPSTGEFAVTEFVGEGIRDKLLSEIIRVKPSELLVGKELEELRGALEVLLGKTASDFPQPRPEQAARKLQTFFETKSLAGFGLENEGAGSSAASMVVSYAERNHLRLEHVSHLSVYSVDGFMKLDAAARRSLELTQNLADGSKKYTLLSVLDTTRTSMGARMLRRWIDQPLLDLELIKARQGSVRRFLESGIARNDLRDALGRLADIERLVSRCATGLATPRDISALSASLESLPKVIVPAEKAGYVQIVELTKQIQGLGELAGYLARAIVADPPHTIRDGGVIRPGLDMELDALRELGSGGKARIAALEAVERDKTGISNLKVGFNSVFGYFIEISKSHLAKVPAEYIRKQTTANAERYITAELKDQEAQVLGAEEKAIALESELFLQLRCRVSAHATDLLSVARSLAELDVLSTFADVASTRKYVCPELVNHDVVQISAGRHPVVEANFADFVPNDLRIDAAEPRCLIITGPNMAGKSTYLRQTALIQLMAQIGCYVPASGAKLGLCDRIFARIGAKDELATGQSTFMVEMIESANILNHATARSLVILDEVGRGTSTFDGLAIAWSMIEYLVSIGCKTLFATHYHQLNTLGEQTSSVANMRVSVEEVGDEIVWTHRVLPGGTDRSYGVHVARMAGIPRAVLGRAHEILAQLEGQGAPMPEVAPAKRIQMTLFESEPSELEKALKELDPNQLTPLGALQLLDSWKAKYR
jgi:DNA mismatch repair protein MutS